MFDGFLLENSILIHFGVTAEILDILSRLTEGLEHHTLSMVVGVHDNLSRGVKPCIPKEITICLACRRHQLKLTIFEVFD